MPRRSAASLTILTSGPRRLEPPPELRGTEADVFRQTVASMAADHFQGEDILLLAAYCRAAALERRAAEELQIGAVVGSMPSPWLAVHASAVRSMATLATKLRIGPRARNPANRRAAKAGPAPSYYDQMTTEQDR